MKKITKILLPVDFSDCSANAFRYAVQFADHIGASIELLHIVYPEGESMDYPVLVARATQSRLESAREALKKFVDNGLTALGQLIKSAPDISSDLEIGTPVATVCNIAKRDDIDLIIMGSRGENRPLIEKWIGSVAAGVVGKSSCPVLVIPENAQFKSIQSMAYATGMQDADPFEIWQTVNLIKPFTPIINVVHVNLKKEGDSKAWEKLEKLKAFFEDRSPGLQINFHHIPGEELEEELNDFIENHGTDLLVMYQPQHNFWDRLFHKSATKKMAIRTHVPLLIQKSE